jgi:hypothetical protein
MAERIKRLLSKGKIGFLLAMVMGSIFCITLGILSLYVFTVAMTHIVKAIDITKSESLLHVFDAIGLVALAVAVLDLAVTIFREIILRDVDKRHPSQMRRSLTRFGTIIIIAILIEGFIMIFRFSKAGQAHLLPYSILVLAGGTMLIIGLGIYIKITVPAETLLDASITDKKS